MLSSLCKRSTLFKSNSLITRSTAPFTATSKQLTAVEEVHKIKQISVYQCDLPLKEGSYNWSSGKSVSVFDSTVISIETDTGYIGHN